MKGVVTAESPTTQVKRTVQSVKRRRETAADNEAPTPTRDIDGQWADGDTTTIKKKFSVTSTTAHQPQTRATIDLSHRLSESSPIIDNKSQVATVEEQQLYYTETPLFELSKSQLAKPIRPTRLEHVFSAYSTTDNTETTTNKPAIGQIVPPTPSPATNEPAATPENVANNTKEVSNTYDAVDLNTVEVGQLSKRRPSESFTEQPLYVKVIPDELIPNVTAATESSIQQVNIVLAADKPKTEREALEYVAQLKVN